MKFKVLFYIRVIFKKNSDKKSPVFAWKRSSSNHSLNTICPFLSYETGRFAPLFFLVDVGRVGIELPLEKIGRQGILTVQTTYELCSSGRGCVLGRDCGQWTDFNYITDPVPPLSLTLSRHHRSTVRNRVSVTLPSKEHVFRRIVTRSSGKN
jgi:hypothetical protein